MCLFLSGLKLRSEVVGSADNRNGLKEELKKLVEKKRVMTRFFTDSLNIPSTLNVDVSKNMQIS